MLDVKDVRFSYKANDEDEFTFNLKAKPEEILVVEGTSGAGKSTLLHLIAGLLIPSCGEISFKGADLVALSPDERPLSMIFQSGIFQSGNLFDHLTCRENVAIGLHPHLRLDQELWHKVDAAMDVLGILPLAKQRPDETSGGQQQRVALARALVRAECQNRDLLLLDEPFSALDPETRQDCIDAVLSLMKTRPMTALIVSHDKNDAKALGATRHKIS